MNKRKLVKKSNSLIESRCNLTLSQQKLILSVVSMIEKSDSEFHEYKLSIHEFKGLLGLTGQGGYSEIRKAAREVKRKDLVISIGPDAELITSWFSDIEIRYKGEIGFFISPKLKPYLLQLKGNFTAYQLRNVLLLKSKYSIRLYELLKQYQNLDCRVFDLDELRSLLYIEPGKYIRFGNFKKRILESATTDINENTDILVSYELKKSGRVITSIKFCITRKDADKANDKTNDKTMEQIPNDILNMIPLSDRAGCLDLCQNIIVRDGIAGLRFYLDKCNARKKSDKGSYGGYLKTISGLNLYADYLAVKQAADIQAKAEHQVIIKQAQKEQKKAQDQAKEKTKREALDDMKTNNPGRYADLREQAAVDQGIDLGKLKRGEGLKLDHAVMGLLSKITI